tara:strand:- start:94 stop:756 length:663 start_codon:yes stop_codon:yes gene_type:complete
LTIKNQFKNLILLSIVSSVIIFINCKKKNIDPFTDDGTKIANADSADENTVDRTKKPPIYLAENGVTIKASDNAEIGESYELGEFNYVVVDSVILYEMVLNDENMTYVVTTRITNLSHINFTKRSFPYFNQDISSWDLSNVTNTSHMFHLTDGFNQNISFWDVSNVTNMNSMFTGAKSFNQDLSFWDVGNVSDCKDFSRDAIAWIEPKPNFINCSADDLD